MLSGSLRLAFVLLTFVVIGGAVVAQDANFAGCSGPPLNPNLFSSIEAASLDCLRENYRSLRDLNAKSQQVLGFSARIDQVAQDFSRSISAVGELLVHDRKAQSEITDLKSEIADLRKASSDLIALQSKFFGGISGDLADLKQRSADAAQLVQAVSDSVVLLTKAPIAGILLVDLKASGCADSAPAACLKKYAEKRATQICGDLALPTFRVSVISDAEAGVMCLR